MRTLAMDGYYRARENIGRYSRIFLGILSLVSEKHMLEYSQLLKGKAGKGQRSGTLTRADENAHDFYTEVAILQDYISYTTEGDRTNTYW